MAARFDSVIRTDIVVELTDRYQPKISLRFHDPYGVEEVPVVVAISAQFRNIGERRGGGTEGGHGCRDAS